MHAAPTILAHFALPRRDGDDREEAVIFAVHPLTNELVMQVAFTPERLSGFTYERPLSVPIPRDAALQLAHEILRTWAPEIAEIVEQTCTEAQFSLVAGGGPPEAS